MYYQRMHILDGCQHTPYPYKMKPLNKPNSVQQ